MGSFDELEKIDILRRRANLSYTQAKELLDAAQGDIVQALVLAEQEGSGLSEELEAKGREALGRAQDLLKKGNRVRLRVRRGEDVLMDIPVAAGLLGTALLPKLALLGGVACIATKCSLEVVKKDEED
ncbi:MAG: DUF4342 domain-containing protein [Limnochordia bacterium]|jgi:hypothetical protein